MGLKDKKKVEKEVKPPERWYVYITYDESRYGGGLQDGEPMEFGCRKDENVEFHVENLWDKSTNWCHEVEVDFDPSGYINEALFLVIVRYSTGSTFGRINGEWFIEGCYTDSAKAFKIAESIEEDTYDGYKPWKGYFEDLESARARGMVLMEYKGN